MGMTNYRTTSDCIELHQTMSSNDWNERS